MSQIHWNFEKVNKRDWIDAAQKELKDKHPDDLILKDSSGVIIEPFYDESDLQKVSDPNFDSFTIKGEGSLNYYTVLSEAGYTSNNDLMAGLRLDANCISLMQEKFDEEETEKALNKVVTDILHWEFQGNPNPIVEWILKENHPFSSIAFSSLPSNHLLLKLIEWSSEKQDIFLISINVESGHNFADINAEALAKLIEVVDQLTRAGAPLNSVLKKLRFRFHLGLDFFGEAARIRAFQKTLDSLLQSYKLKETVQVILHGIATSWVNDKMGPHESMLKGTTNVTSAIIGGCNSFQVVPADPKNEMQRRIAWHTYNVLSEEAHLNKVMDPGKGSYFFEDITWQIAEKSLERLKQIEADGGYSKIIIAS